MTTTKNIFKTWLEYTRLQFPISGALQVGSSSTFTLSRQVEWQTPSLLLIEPDEIRADKLSAAVENHANWIVKQAVVSNHIGEEIFYSASNPNESGLLKPEMLAPIWRNIKTLEQRRLTCTTIDSLMEQHKELSNKLNWLVIDCLSAVTIIQGAQQHIKDFDVIIVRSILDNSLFENTGTTRDEIDAVLVKNSFCYICCEEELHPSVGKLLYIRDLKKQLVETSDLQTKSVTEKQSQLELVTKARDEQTKLATERQIQLEQLTKAIDEAAKLAEERKVQLEAVAEEKAELVETRDLQTKSATEKQSQLELVTKAWDEQTKLAEELQILLDQLTKAKDEAAKLAEERKVQLEAIAKEKAELVETFDLKTKSTTEKQSQLEQVTKAKDEQTKLAAERQAEIVKLKASLQEADIRRNQLEAQIAEREQRQQLMNEEMIRAEGQIDLIKDLLLREPGL